MSKEMENNCILNYFVKKEEMLIRVLSIHCCIYPKIVFQLLQGLSDRLFFSFFVSFSLENSLEKIVFVNYIKKKKIRNAIFAAICKFMQLFD